MTGKGIPIGPVGKRVAHNVQGARGFMSYAELSRRLEAHGRDIPPLGLRRIESGDRRVDVDDLVALAAVLGVTPGALLAGRVPLRAPAALQCGKPVARCLAAGMHKPVCTCQEDAGHDGPCGATPGRPF